MASTRKEWEMAFLLSASVGSSFNSSFTQANTKLISLEKELRNLQKVQSDINGYQKQEKSIENTREKLANYQKQLETYQKQQQTGAGLTEKETREMLKLEQRIKDTNEALANAEKRHDALGERLQEEGVDVNNLSQAQGELAAKIGEVTKEQEKAKAEAEDYGESASAAFEAAAQAITAAGLIEKIKEVYAAYKECIDVAAQLQQTMSVVEAVSSASSEEMALLNEKARDLGLTTKFTANEAGEAMTYMGMAGWSAAEMLEGMDAVIALAAAGGEDLATTSSIMTDNLTAFGLSAADAAHFADVLAAAAVNSNTDVGKMGNTFKTSAAVAGALGFSIEDVAVAVGLMANNGIKATMAGTSLRNIFNGLQGGVTLNADAFGELDYSAQNADGSMKSLAQIVNELRGYFDQMGEAEKTANAMTIAGLRGYAGLIAVLNATEEDFNDMRMAIDGCAGSAERMAEIKMDNYAGQVKLVNSAWDAIKTTIGDMFLPTLEDLAGNLRDVLIELNEMVKANPELVKGLTVFGGTLALTTVGLTSAGAAVTMFNKVIKPLIATLGAGTAAMTLGVGAIAAYALAMGAVAEGMRTEEDELRLLTATSREQYREVQSLRAEYDSACESLGATSAEAQLLKVRLDEAEASFESSKQTAKEVRDAQQSLKDQQQELIDSYQTAMAGVDDYEESNLNLMERLMELSAVEDKDVAQKQEMLTIIELLNDAVPNLNLAYDEQADSLNLSASHMRTILEMEVALEDLEAKRAALKDAISTRNQYKESAEAAKAELEARQKEYDLAKASYDAFLSENPKPQSPSAAGERNWTAKASPYTGDLARAEAELAKAQQASDDATAAYERQEQIITDLEYAYDSTSEAVDGIVPYMQAVENEVAALTQAYKDAYSAAYESISGQYDLWDEAAEISAIKVKDLNKNISGQADYWSKYNENITSLIERSADIEGLGDLLASLADGSEESVNTVAGMAKASDTDLQKMVENWQALKEEQQKVAESIADLKTGYTDAMDQLIEDMGVKVSELNFTDEAGEAAKQTIQGFIDGASSNEALARVSNAYAAVAQAAIDAINAKFDINSPSRVMMETADMTWAGFINETEALRPKVAALMSGVAGSGIDALSAGFSGIEPVAPTITASSAQQEGVTISVAFNIEGNADEAAVSTLRDYGEEFAQRVLEVIEEAKTDAGRRAYN